MKKFNVYVTINSAGDTFYHPQSKRDEFLGVSARSEAAAALKVLRSVAPDVFSGVAWDLVAKAPLDEFQNFVEAVKTVPYLIDLATEDDWWTEPHTKPKFLVAVLPAEKK